MAGRGGACDTEGVKWSGIFLGVALCLLAIACAAITIRAIHDAMFCFIGD